MQRQNTPHPSGVQHHREDPIQSAWIDRQFEYFDEHLRKMLFGEYKLNVEAARRILADFIAKYPEDRHMPRDRIAIHEAAHGVAFEATGALLLRIKLDRGKRKGEGWEGIATPCDPPPLQPRYCTPEGLLSDAIFTLAGPMAEELYAEGIAMANAWEILHARACVTRAAEMTSEDDEKVWRETLERAAALLHVNRKNIGDLAALLLRQAEITRTNRAVKKILARVKLDDGATPLKSLDLIEHLSEVPAFLAEVRK